MENLTNQIFGNLQVLGLADVQRKGFRSWLCKCVCGNFTVEVTGKLKYGHKTSCGCMRRKRAEALKRFGPKHKLWRGCGQLSGSIWHRITASAKKRHKEITIDINYAWKLFQDQQGKCALSGRDIYFAKSSAELKVGKNTASLDRIDNTKGYVCDNVQWVHVVINYMKQELSKQEFINWCASVISQNGSQEVPPQTP